MPLIYLDTSALLSFYIQRQNTPLVRESVENFPGPLLGNQFLLAEVESALWQLKLTAAQIRWFNTHLFSEIRR